MAHAVIGGLITSALLTLVVVPVVYTYLDDVGARAGAYLRRWTAAPEGAPDPVPRPTASALSPAAPSPATAPSAGTENQTATRSGHLGVSAKTRTGDKCNMTVSVL